jgi:CHAT domain-containing protein
MEPIKVSGKLTGKDLSHQQDETFKDILSITCTQEIQLASPQRGDRAEQVTLQDIDKNTLLELEFEGGYKRWVSAGQLRNELGQSVQRSAGEPGLHLAPLSFNTSQTRGTVGLVLKFLRVLNIDPVGDLADVIASEIVSRLETRRVPQPGIYRCTETTIPRLPQTSLQPEQGELPINTGKPVLLLIHGTFSSTEGTFHDLWESRSGYNASSWLQRLFAPYDGQVYTLEHHTLTVSPVQNALQVLRQLPANTRLHLITHSRGGMVGELLCQGGIKRRTRSSGDAWLDTQDIFTLEELREFEGSERLADREGLLEIARLLQEKQIRVERFVRVACPARGTVLASARLETSLSILFNVLNLLPVKYLGEMADFVRMVLMAVAKKRTEPDELPGLEAMMPSSPLVRLLNRPNVCQPESQLAVIAGNVKASSLLGYLKAWATECFFGEENDYVVNTASMYGGIIRDKIVRFYADQRDTSSHFSYFRDLQLLERLLNALQDKDDNQLRVLEKGVVVPRLRSETQPSRKDKNAFLYFLPGFMGSTLLADNNKVWLDMGALSWGDFTSLKMASPNVLAGEVLDSAYHPLLEMLNQKYQVVRFAYDWRRSALENGRRLGDLLTQALDKAQDEKCKLTIRFLAHSTGGLVLAGMISEKPTLWKRLQEETDCRCVLLGTPLLGSFTFVQLLQGSHRLTGLLNMADGQAPEAEGRAHENEAIADQFSAYPGVLELLPTDYLAEDQWRNVLGDRFANWPARALLGDAQRVRAQLRTVQFDPACTLYVHGKSHLTPAGLESDAGTWRFRATGEGDGVTLWNPSGFQGQRWFMPVEHGRMASHPDYFTAIQSLLVEGNSHQLDRVPPQAGVAAEQWLPEIKSELFPNEAELQAAALGYHTSLTLEESRPQVEVWLVHGNLEYVSNTLAVGHYEGDGILSTERVLDDCLQGRLVELQRMNRYPGALKTSAVLFNPGKRPSGALIIGLGEVGKLTASNLLASFTDALIHYALDVRSNLACLGNTAREPDTDFTPVGISTLLIGTMGGGLSLSDCIASILRAASRANLMLDKSEAGMKMRFTSIEFVELYEDRAVEATRLLRSMETYPEFRQDFSFRKLMGSLPGNRRRVMYRDNGEWWRRLQIELHEDGLKYTALTDRARAELSLHATQRKLVDQIIAQAVSTSLADPELGKILFELLLPSEMKEQAPNADNLVLVVDEAAGNYPWELLQDRRNPDAEPMSVRSGMLRQLILGQFKGVRRGAVERSALVVGNPPVGGNFADLPNAQTEAENVAKQLEEGGFTQVVQEIHTHSQDVLHSLLTGDYRAIHLAGHGVFGYKMDKDQPEGKQDKIVTGMVLGDGIFLTPVEIEQMRTTPDFVFINCCNLAKMDLPDVYLEGDVSGRHSEFASGFAQALIRLGVKAVVASGWAIDDDVAKVFSETCYHLLLQGQPFGKAVQMARKKAWEHNRKSNTWGAYQCYGDPEYRLVSNRRDEAQTASTQDQWCFVAEIEVVTELQNLANEADTSQEARYPDLRNKIQNLHASIPSEWLGDAGILYGLGRVYSKLEMYPQALKAYQAAIDSPQADYPVVLLEDKVSLQTAWALACAEGRLEPEEGNERDKFIASLMDDSRNTLELLGKLGNSLQRLEEEGKYWKRQCIMAPPAKREEMLLEMELAYGRAHAFAKGTNGNDKIAVYPLNNWMTARVVRHLRGSLKHLERRKMQGWLKQAQQQADAADNNIPSFMSGITRAECILLDYLLDNHLEDTRRMHQAVGCYAEAIARGTAPRKARYVVEHLNFLKLMLTECADQKPQLQPVLNALLDIETKLIV